MSFLTKWIYGRAKTPKKRKRRLLIFIAACLLTLGSILRILKIDTEFFLLAGFGMYTFAELFE